MKLIRCNACGDVVSLRREHRTCFCGKSSGVYTDNLNATIAGPCLPLGFHNRSLVDAIYAQLQLGDSAETFANGLVKGRDFIAFIIPESAPTVKRGK